jgi:hypothetical protein
MVGQKSVVFVNSVVGVKRRSLAGEMLMFIANDEVSYMKEVGVRFRNLVEDEEPLDEEKVFTYTWKQVSTGRTGTGRVAILGAEDDFRKLMAHWNRSPELWIYS